jgi:photosystem II stability/assembly factor-like uncharacterized protein
LLGGCPSDNGLDPDAAVDLWPRFDHGADGDQRPPPDLNPDCPTLDLGDDALGAMGWRVVQTAGVPLHDVTCAQGHVFVAGDKGTLLHRPPDGHQCGGFSPQQVPTQANLLTVAFTPDLLYGAAAGEHPMIWETKDEGKTWEVAPQCGDIVFSVFNSLHLYSSTKGFGAGTPDNQAGAAYKVYAGKTWICPTQTFPNQLFYDAFQLEDNAWVVGSTKGNIYHTPDHAGTWFITDTGVQKPLHGVFFRGNAGALEGVAVGDEGTILRSTDGKGLDWTQVTTLGTDDLRGVYMWDDKLGWIVGDNGTVMHTEDGGQIWTYQSAPTAERLEAVCFSSATEGWAVGDGGSILHTTTGGK